MRAESKTSEATEVPLKIQITRIWWPMGGGGNFSMSIIDQAISIDFFLTTAPFSLTMEETCRFRGTTENYVVIITFITIFLLSVIGNALVIVVIMQVSRVDRCIDFIDPSRIASATRNAIDHQHLSDESCHHRSNAVRGVYASNVM